MKIKDFINKAIEGSDAEKGDVIRGHLVNYGTVDLALPSILLDPKAWEAVGKVEGWDNDRGMIFNERYTDKNGKGYLVPCKSFRTQNSWQYYMHRMIDALSEGKTIEEYIKTL